jgi:hypothetical protein
MVLSRAEAQRRVFQKLVDPSVFTDMRPLLPTDLASELTDDMLKTAFARVMTELIDRIPGDERAKADRAAKSAGRPSIWLALFS